MFCILPFELHCALVQTLVGEVRTPGQWPHSRSHLHCAGQGVIYCVWFLAVRFIVILWRIYVGPRHDTFIVLTLGSSSSPQPTRSQPRARVSQSEAGTGSRDQHAGHVCCYLGYGRAQLLTVAFSRAGLILCWETETLQAESSLARYYIYLSTSFESTCQ